MDCCNESSNSSSDKSFYPINITFTNNCTLFNDSINLDDEFLKIDIIPTSNGDNIRKIKIVFFDCEFGSTKIFEEICEERILSSINNSIKGDDYSCLLEKVDKYVSCLSREDREIIEREFERYCLCIQDIIIFGIVSYLSFILLSENDLLVSRLPFQFCIPYSISSGMLLTRNTIKYMTLPISTLIKSTDGIMLQLFTFIQSFINIFDQMFHKGQTIDPLIETKLSVDVLSGYSQYIINELTSCSIQNEIQNDIQQKIRHSEVRMYSFINEEIDKIRDECYKILENRTNYHTICNDDINKLTENMHFADTSEEPSLERKNREIRNIKDTLNVYINKSKNKIKQDVEVKGQYTRKFTNKVRC